MNIALVGNPNCGKTTVFNRLTKLNQKTGNWSGVTVEKKEGKYYADKSINIIDLPGIYSLNPISDDERVSRDFLLQQKPDAVINIIDSSNLERSLQLTLQLMEFSIPIVLALNMQDELKSHNISINTKNIESELGLITLLISAKKNANLDQLMQAVVSVSVQKKLSPFFSIGQTEEQKIEFRHKFIADKIDLFRVSIPVKSKCLSSCAGCPNAKAKSTEIKPVQVSSKIKHITHCIDSVVLNKWLAFPIFAAIIFFMFFVSIQTLGQYSTSAVEWFFFDFLGQNLRDALLSINAPNWIIALTVDAIINGVGTVMSFVPQIILLFLFISILEKCGYMARVAVIMDKLFKKLGLSGKSFIPMIVGCGCSVPAIMCSKTIENKSEQRNTIMLAPFVPCSAKLPVFALIASALFPNNPFVAPSMYFLGIIMVILGALILKIFNPKSQKQDTFIMELPHYRLPIVKDIALTLWEKTQGFVVRAAILIVPAAIVLWFLQSFSFDFKMVNIEESMLAWVGKSISWIFSPLGFGNWQSSIAILTGIFAKETVVATFSIILGGDINLRLAELFTQSSAYAFMAFTLLSAPCVSALAATKKELGSAKLM
ncbi:MAG: ferrous iron transport protein B, partial [Clostridiales bacterium]|nr:ferrous iron transport protein B [Clostridiales bacterium]